VFENSPVSERIFGYFNCRIGQRIAPIGLLKALGINSASYPYPRLPLIHEARSREWKTITSLLAMKMFSEDFYIYISGEKTIHGMVKDYGKVWHKRCLIINDGNLLFSALSKRSRDRWLSAISVLLTEKRYEYSDNINRFTVIGWISLLINIPTPSYTYYKNELFRTTLGNRTLIVHPWLTAKQNRRCKDAFEKTKNMKFKDKITERYKRTIKNLSEYKEQIRTYADDYSALAVKSPSECEDHITAIVTTNARLNHRNYIHEDDMLLVRMLRNYLIDPLVPNEPRVIEFLKQGRSYPDIIHLLGKKRSYYATISYYKKKAIKRGVLDVD